MELAETQYPNFMMWLIRRKNLISQADLAKVLDKSTGLVSLWCNGKQLPTLDTLVLMCKHFTTEIVDEEDLLQEAVKCIRIDILLKNGAYDDFLVGEQ